MEAMTLTRPAARTGSSAPALIPTGNPSETRIPHSSAPANASGGWGENTNSSRPAIPTSARPRTAATRP